jgi:hypothetical protein
MRHSWMVVGAAALMGLLTSCATSPVKRTEKTLTQSGFQAVKVVSPAHQQQLNKLPANKVSLVKRQGKVFYVFPDPARNVLYVGNKTQYHAYQIALQDQHLAEDAKLIRDYNAAPVLSEDDAMMSGVDSGWDLLWEGWPLGD